MKQFLVLLLALSSLTAFAESMSVKHKVVSVTNIGTKSSPEALVHLAVEASVKAYNQTRTERWIIALKADGSAHEVFSPSRDFKSNYKLIQRMNLGDSKSTLKSSLFQITVTHENNFEESKSSSIILVKENGDVQIMK